tara:strand:+ start:529 stop:708 length:180 start_codon:yes stop_codon:yes gene_type:complete
MKKLKLIANLRHDIKQFGRGIIRKRARIFLASISIDPVNSEFASLYAAACEDVFGPDWQ